MNTWALQDAKNKFSAVVNAALDGEPQMVTRRGMPAVVILAEQEFERLRRIERLEAPTLGEFLIRMPQDDQEFDRIDLAPRALDD